MAEGCPLTDHQQDVSASPPMTMGPANGYWSSTGPGPSSSRVTLLQWVKPLQKEEAARWLKQEQLRGRQL